MANPDVIKNFQADGDVGAYLLLKPGSDDNQVAVAAAATDALIGASTFVAAKDGAPCDAVLGGIADVYCGDDVAFGDPITSDADGKAVKAAPVAGANARLAGVALCAGAAGDLIQVLLSPSVMQG